MKILTIGIITILLSGCMSQAEYDDWKARNRMDSMSQSSTLSTTGAGLTFTNGSVGAMNNYSFNKPIDKKALDAEVAARRAKAKQVADEASARLAANELSEEAELKRRTENDEWIRQNQNKPLNCRQKAINTYNILKEQAYLTGDYTMYMKYDVKSLESICEKTK